MNNIISIYISIIFIVSCSLTHKTNMNNNIFNEGYYDAQRKILLNESNFSKDCPIKPDRFIIHEENCKKLLISRRNDSVNEIIKENEVNKFLSIHSPSLTFDFNFKKNILVCLSENKYNINIYKVFHDNIFQHYYIYPKNSLRLERVTGSSLPLGYKKIIVNYIGNICAIATFSNTFYMLYIDDGNNTLVAKKAFQLSGKLRDLAFTSKDEVVVIYDNKKVIQKWSKYGAVQRLNDLPHFPLCICTRQGLIAVGYENGEYEIYDEDFKSNGKSKNISSIKSKYVLNYKNINVNKAIVSMSFNEKGNKLNFFYKDDIFVKELELKTFNNEGNIALDQSRITRTLCYSSQKGFCLKVILIVLGCIDYFFNILDVLGDNLNILSYFSLGLGGALLLWPLLRKCMRCCFDC